VLEVEGTVAGFTTVYTRVPFERLDEPPRDYAIVAELLVRREYRRSGYARALLAHGERHAASQGAAELRIGVQRLAIGARVIDAGVNVPGGFAAGRALAERVAGRLVGADFALCASLAADGGDGSC